ncbi:hypothetical protein ACIRIU_08530 [Streptomyces sp. NPDC102351]|uniref:hypothetical protein n=1 Tax=Streptomyces sp. NPDC102351 TaxID=3366158 RepID=UPI003800C23B
MAEGKDVEALRRHWQANPEQQELDLALGFMVRQAATVEFFLHQTVRRLVGGRHAALVTLSMQASGLLDAIKRIIDVGAVSEEAAEEMAEISRKCRIAFKERNKHVHGVRMIGTGASEIWTNNRRNGGIDQHPVEAEKLVELGIDLARLEFQLSEWNRHHLDGHPKRRNRTTSAPDQAGNSGE